MVAQYDAYATNENTELKVVLPHGVLENDTDVDGDLLTALLVSGVANGTLALNPDGSFLYTPASQFSGTDSFTWKTNDGTADSNTASCRILVRAETRDGISEEIPEAYKDVDAVINVVHNAGLAKRVARLRPIGVIKG